MHEVPDEAGVPFCSTPLRKIKDRRHNVWVRPEDDVGSLVAPWTPVTAMGESRRRRRTASV
jgi:hypothetical protein